MYPRVKIANKASPEKLRSTLARYYSTSTPTTLIAPVKDSNVTVQVYSGNKLPMALQNWIFELFETNMKQMYEATQDGYDPKEKKEELFDQQSRFLVLRSPDSTSPFAYGMFRFDSEETTGPENAEVLYCYEVQIDPKRQSTGAGKLIVDLMYLIAKDWHMEKVMLTCFKSNSKALKFYDRNGFSIDEISPSKSDDETAEYEILSRKV